MSKKTILTAEKVSKTYSNGSKKTRVLEQIDLQVEEGEFLAITGRSGSGKSTLLYILSLLDRPSEGRIIFQNCDTGAFSDKKDARCRLYNFGFVFQNYALLPELTALGNVMLSVVECRSDWSTVREESIDDRSDRRDE